MNVLYTKKIFVIHFGIKDMIMRKKIEKIQFFINYMQVGKK